MGHFWLQRQSRNTRCESNVVGDAGTTIIVMLSDAEILRKIERQPRQSAGYKQLVRELRIKGDGRQELKERLADLVRRGKLIADAEKFMIPVSKPSKNQIFGRLTMHRDGYGFVIP